MQKDRNLENIDFPMVFTIYSARSPFAMKTKIDATGGTAPLQKNSETTQANIRKISKNLQTSCKNLKKNKVRQTNAF